MFQESVLLLVCKVHGCVTAISHPSFLFRLFQLKLMNRLFVVTANTSLYGHVHTQEFLFLSVPISGILTYEPVTKGAPAEPGSVCILLFIFVLLQLHETVVAFIQYALMSS